MNRLCRICYTERPEENIAKHFHTWHPGTKYEHTVYTEHCNDNAECAEKAKTKDFGPMCEYVTSPQAKK